MDTEKFSDSDITKVSDQYLNLQPGTIINGRYEVVKCLGTGSMGMVYACRHRELSGHLVAMKVLFATVARDEIAVTRFRNEIVASYGVNHPNVVRAFEYFRDGDLIAYTMEYVPGGDLADKIGSDNFLSIPEIMKTLLQLTSGLKAIHDAGIIHRDIKPENILLTLEGDIKITDFGIARMGSGPKLTEHGGVVGTIDYVSPEYLEKGQVDEKSDIYALAVLAYELITGEAPFKGKSVIETMTLRLRSEPESPKKLREECPDELARIVLKAMARIPSERYQSAQAIHTDLLALIKDKATIEELEKFAEDKLEKTPTIKFNRDSAKDELAKKRERIKEYLLNQIKEEENRDRPNENSFDSNLQKKSDLGDSENSEFANEELANSEMEIFRSRKDTYMPKVAVSQSNLSVERVKELSNDIYSYRNTPAMIVIIWMTIFCLGFTFGFYVINYYWPELIARESLLEYYEIVKTFISDFKIRQ